MAAHEKKPTAGVVAESVKSSDPGRNGIVVLLVDDQPMIGEAVRRFLSSETDIVYVYCSDPEKAMSVALEVLPTVILQDLVMPDVDGLELLRRFRSEDHTSRVPIVVLSTKEDPAVKKQAFELGANDYLVKLPDRVELIARVRHHSNAYLSRLQRDAAIHALSEALRDKDEFLRIASHDLKNPLSMIYGSASILEKQLRPETGADEKAEENYAMISIVVRQAENMRLLIEDYLDAQAIEDGQLQLDLKQLDLNIISQACVSDAMGHALKKNTQLEIANSTDPVTAVCDRNRIMQVAMNLLSNAIKFSPFESVVQVRTYSSLTLPGGVPSTSEQIGENLPQRMSVFEVTDNGPGLQEADFESLFGRYARLSARPTGGEKSTGLGLSICKRLIELHNGHIGALNNPESQPGATFWFALPATSGGANV